MVLDSAPPPSAPAAEPGGPATPQDPGPAAGRAAPADPSGRADPARPDGEPADADATAADEPPDPIQLDTAYDDRRAGERAAKEVEQALGLLEDAELVAYVKAVGERLVPHAPSQPFDYRFGIVDQTAPNAFALPGGYIYVSRGLLLLSNSEDELANVLAHEIVHAALRHAAARQHVVEELPGFLQLLQLPRLLAYGRNQERTADRLGQELAARAGYDPAGMTTFLRQLELHARLEHGASLLPSFLDTHPSTVERLALASARAGQLAWSRQELLAPGRAAYLGRLEGLAAGTPAREGVFRGSLFVHPDLGFLLRFPEGWDLRNTHTAVGAIAPDRKAQLVLEGQGKGEDPERAAQKWLAKAMRQGLNVAAQEPLTLAGSPAWRVRGTATTPGGRVVALITWIAWRGSIYRIAGLTHSGRYEGVLWNAARSFRPAPAELVQGVTESRMRVAAALPGESLASLSRRTGNVWSLQRTAVMNALFATEALAGGQLVKVAIDVPYAPDGDRAPGAEPREARRAGPGDR